ncbi:MAG: hypothetical protein ACE5HA_08835 [Anaerolineae bacterium]
MTTRQAIRMLGILPEIADMCKWNNVGACCVFALANEGDRFYRFEEVVFVNRGLWTIAALLLTLLVGCAAPPTPGTQPGQSPRVHPADTPSSGGSTEAEEMIQVARTTLMAQLKQAGDVFELVDVQPAEWPTAAMGCPQPDQIYAQVITPGYVVRLRTDSNMYEVHVSKNGQVVLCETGEESSAMKVPAAAEPAIMAARRDLASRVGVEVEEVGVQDFQTVDWSDSSLGCPEPGRMYLQVITPGYRVILQAAGQSYEYHTNQGNRAVLCETATAVSPPSQKLRLQELRDAVERARNDLAQRLGVAPASILVNNASLLTQVEQSAPCPERNQLTGSGDEYQIMLQAEGSTYTYRARGETVVLCSE